MFERYTDPAKRVIFYARATAIVDRAPMVDPTHLLRGLMWPDTSRAEVLFRLRDKFSHYLKSSRSRLNATWKGRDVRLTDDAKRVLSWSVIEADAMGDRWVDTDHLLLGILHEAECQAAQQLTGAGVTLEGARLIVTENCPSRPDYGPVIPLGTTPSVRVWLTSKWRCWRARRIERRFAAHRPK